MNYGSGLCIPVDADKTDGKVTTKAFQYNFPVAVQDGSWRDKGTPTTPAVRPNPTPFATIPSQSVELECGASSLVAATTAAVALFSLV